MERGVWQNECKPKAGVVSDIPLQHPSVRDDISSYVRCTSSEVVTVGSGQKLPAVRPGVVWSWM